MFSYDSSAVVTTLLITVSVYILCAFFYYPMNKSVANTFERCKYYIYAMTFKFKKMKYKRMVNKIVKILNSLDKKHKVPKDRLSSIYDDVSESWEMLNESFSRINKLHKCHSAEDMHRITRGIKYGTVKFCVCVERLRKEIENLIENDS